MWGTSVSLTERSAALRLVVCAALAAAVAWSQSADTWTIDTIAGTGTGGYSGDEGAATAARLNYPRGVAVDGSGNLYIADANNHRIRKIDASSGNISTVAGTGTEGYSGDEGAATAARLNLPLDVALDGSGNLYIADRNNHRIRKIDASSGNISTVAGTGTFGYSGDEGAATAAQLNHPYGVALDGSGNLYIADTFNGRIRKVDASTGNISTIAGAGIAGETGDGGAATAARLDDPFDMAVDTATGNLYISDSSNDRIRKVDASTGNISTVAGTGRDGFSGDGGAATAAQLDYPHGVAVDGSGNLYIADADNSRIRKVDAAGVISTVAGDGTRGFGGDGGPAVAAQLKGPYDVVVDASGNLYISDTENHRIRKVTRQTSTPPPPPPSITASPPTLSFTLSQGATTRSEQVVLTAGPGGANFTVISGQNWLTAQPNSGSLNAGESKTITVTANPAGLTAKAYSGQLLIAVSGGAPTQVAVSLTVTPPPSIRASPPTLSFTLPQGATTQSKRVVLTAGPGGADFTVTSDQGWLEATPKKAILSAGTSITLTVTAASAGLTARPHSGRLSIAVTGGAAVEVAVSLNVTVAEADSGWTIDTIAGTGTRGYSGDGGAATAAQLTRPTGVALDSVGNVYIADGGNNRIRKVDASTGNISTFAGTGTRGYSGDGGAATETQLNFPNDIAMDSSDNLYIADASNHRIRKVDAVTGNISTLAGTGTRGYSGDGGAATEAQLYSPTAVAVDSAGNVYIGDGLFNGRIRKVDTIGNISTILNLGAYPSGVAVDGSGNVYIAALEHHRIRKVDAAGNISTFAGTGTGGFNGDGGAATTAQLNSPSGVAVDGSGNVYIADRDNYRIRKVDAAGNISTFAGTGTEGFSGDGGAAASAKLDQPAGMAVDGSGNLYFIDSDNNRIRKVTRQTPTPPPPPPSITPSPPNLSFTLPQGTAARSEQVVLTAGPGGADFTVIPGQNWLTAQPNSGSLDAGESETITVTANPAGLTAKAYSGQLLIAVSGGAPTRVAVSLTVQPSASITASPSTLSFTLPQGAAARSKQVVLTAGPGGANFTVTPIQNWLTAQPNSGSLNAGESETITVTANPAGLTAGGPHSGQLSIAVSGGASTRVAVSLTVTPPASITASPTTLSFTLPQGAAARSEQVVLTAGPGGADFTVIPGQNWLTAQPNSGSLNAGESRTITVTANPTGLTADTYSGQLSIAVSGATATQVVTVSLTVQPPASITASPTTLSFTLPQGAAAQNKQVFLTAGAEDANFTVTVPPDQSWLTALPNSGSLDAGESETITVTANPTGLTADTYSGQLSIAVSGGAATQVVTVSLNVTAAAVVWTIDTIAGTGTRGFSGDGGAATAAQLSGPSGVAVDGAGNLYIADSLNHRIRKVDAAGLISTVAGSGTPGFGGDSGPARQAQFALPSSVAADSLGNLYIADTFNHRIRRVDAATGIVDTVAGNGTSGFGGDDGPALQAQLARPYGVALDSSGNLYIADSFNHRIRKVDAAGLISTVAGNGTSGFGGDGRAALQAQLNNPVGVATDSSGNLYIADSDNDRIRKVDAAGLISTAAGNGTSGFSGDGSSALQAQLDNPVGVAADGAGNLYISDWDNQRIRRVDAATGLVATIAGNGTLGFGGDDGPGTAALLAFPRGLAVDVSGNLYIADTLNNRIRRLTSMPRISPGGIILGAGRPVVDRISPNAIVSVFGHDLAPPGRRTLILDPAGLIAANLASTCLEIDGKRAPLFFVSPTQINAQVPHDLTVTAEQTTAVVVRGCGTTSERRSAAATVAVGTVSPAFFNWVNNTDGRNPIIALHGGGPDLVGAPGLLPGVKFTPAEPGEFVTLFGTGFGATEPPLATGEIPGTAVTFNLANAVAFTFGGIAVPPEDVFYAGASPCCAGLYQFTVRLPANLPDGDATVTAVVQGVSTPQGPFLSVRRR